MKKLIFLLSLLLLAACTSKPVASRLPASATNQPSRIVLIGSNAEIAQYIRYISASTCLVQGARIAESLESHQGLHKGLNYDDDGNRLTDDRYGWQFGPGRSGSPAKSLVQELNLAGEWPIGDSARATPTDCKMIFTVILENEAVIISALKYLEQSGLLQEYVGPVEIAYGSAPELRTRILRLFANPQFESQVTDLSLKRMF